MINIEAIGCCLGFGDDDDDDDMLNRGLKTNQLITREILLWQIEREVASLFKIFDRDGSGMIDRGRELENMISELKHRGFVFGRKKEGLDCDAALAFNGYESSPSNRSTISQYHPVLSKSLRTKIIKTHGDDEGGGLTKQEFHDWLLKEVLKRRTNLRLLLKTNRWLDGAIRDIFEQSDEDDSGTVSPDELLQPLRDVATSLGEPPPSDASIERILCRADSSHDGQLDYDEFKYVIVEVAARLFYSHFNESMAPHATLIKHTHFPNLPKVMA